MVTSKCNTCTEHTSWENVLDCFGPFQQEAHGFLSPESIAVLKLGLRSQYGDSSDSRRDLLDLLSIDINSTVCKYTRRIWYGTPALDRTSLDSLLGL